MGQHDIALDRTIAKNGARIVSMSNYGYEVGAKNFIDIDNDDWATKKMLIDYIGSLPFITYIVINLTSSDPADYDYHYTGPATLTNLKIQAWQPFTDGTYGAVYVPYSITPLLIMATGHIILRRVDVGDVVRVVIST